MKKKVAVLCAAAMAAGTFSAMAAEMPEKVEILFKVGDSTLTVNGAPLQVTAPYVVGDGTTLVPVRVITEAFGAEVTWNGNDQSVNLKYPDVDISIKIGSKSAVVNTHSEELAAAPEIFDDTTMVPLRFISETFGATVDYNDGYITVTKENKKDDEEQSTVVGVTDKDFIGDSFYGWTIRNPKSFTMEDRSFDGIETAFKDEDDNLIVIYVDEQEDDFDADEEFNAVKQDLSSDTISIADKTALNDGSTKIHFRSKDKEVEFDVIEYVKGNRTFTVMVGVPLDSDKKDDIFAIAQSFSITEKRDFYDLSNVVDGTREFKDETYGVSLKLPANWEQNEYSKPNVFSFHSTGNSRNYASLGIYSKSDTVSAQQLAESDRQSHVDIGNPQFSTVNAVSPIEVNGVAGYRYTVMYSGFGEQTYVLDDTFLEVGDYVYNIAAACKNMDDAEKIISTLLIEKLDSEKIGTILRDSEIGGTSKMDFADGKVTAGSGWTSIGGATLIDGRTGAVLLGMTMSNNNGATPKAVVNMLVDNDKKSKKASTVGNLETKSIDGLMYYSQTVTYKADDKACCYATYYAVQRKGQIYIFNYTRYDLYYGGCVDTEVWDIISSLEIKE